MSVTICIPDESTTRDITDIAVSIRDALASNDAVVLDLSAVKAADLSLVQAIEAARRLAARDGRSLRLAYPVHPLLSSLLDRAGFLAAASPADVDFWFHGDLPQ